MSYIYCVVSEKSTGYLAILPDKEDFFSDILLMIWHVNYIYIQKNYIEDLQNERKSETNKPTVNKFIYEGIVQTSIRILIFFPTVICCFVD